MSNYYLYLQEYLDYQRHVHLQYLAQQESEMKTRIEQQRQLILAREQHTQNPHLVIYRLLYIVQTEQKPHSYLYDFFLKDMIERKLSTSFLVYDAL
jgi:hypothetical protein